MSELSEFRESAVFDVLTKDNYNSWRTQAESLLREYHLWDHVEEENESISDVDKRELWMKKDKLVKSKLILCISTSLLPLVENCKTAREVWLKLANVYGNNGEKREDSDTDDEDTIINEIESCVDDFFETINNSSVNKISEIKESLTKTFTDKLFSRLKINCVKKLPDVEMIVRTICDFIDEIDEFSKIQIKEMTNELSNELIDILLVKFTINPHKNDDTDEDAVINAIESSVDEFFDIINDSSEKKITEIKKLLSTNFTDKLSSRLKTINIKQLPDKNTIVNTISSFIDDIDELSKIKIKTQKNELSGKLIDSLLLNFNINPYKNDNDEGKSNAKGAEIRDNVVDGEGRQEKNRLAYNDLMKQIDNELSRYERNFDNEGDCSRDAVSPALIDLYTPPPTPRPNKSQKCGVCRREGHNRTTCPLNKSTASASKSATATSRLGSVSPASSCTSKISVTPKRSYKCGLCGGEGHNRTSPKCPLNKSTTSVSESTATIPETPKRSYKCGLCDGEGHNRTSPKCPLNKSTTSVSESTATISETPRAVETPTRSYKCGLCGQEGHNMRTCGGRQEISSPTPTKTAYRCGTCGGEGHNSRTCGRRETSSSSYSTPSYSSYPSPAPTKTVYRCGTCGGEGHNSRTCGRREISSLSYSTPSYSYSSYAAPAQSYSSYSAPAPSYSGGGRSYTCGRCGGSGHNRRTCSG